MKYPKRSQYKYAKSPYRVRNWPEYEAGLRRRGDLTIWLSEDAIKTWRAPSSGEPGGQRVYANIAIESALTIAWSFIYRSVRLKASCGHWPINSMWIFPFRITRRSLGALGGSVRFRSTRARAIDPSTC